MVLLQFSHVSVTVVNLSGNTLWGPHVRHVHSAIRDLGRGVCSCIERQYKFQDNDLVAGVTRLRDEDILTSAVLAANSSRMRLEHDPDFCATKGCIRVPGHDGPCQDDNLEEVPSAFCLELTLISSDALFPKAEVIALVRGEPFDIVYDNLSACGGNLASAGYDMTVTARQLQEAGIRARQAIDSGLAVNLVDLREAGLSVKELKDHGFDNPSQLAISGFSMMQLLEGGFTIREVFSTGSDKLAIARQLKDGGLDPSMLRESFKLKRGIGPSPIAKCPILLLMRAGFTAGQLQAAGFEEQDRIKAIEQADWDAGKLRMVGYGSMSLKEVGFSDVELAKAGFAALKHKGLTMLES